MGSLNITFRKGISLAVWEPPKHKYANIGIPVIQMRQYEGSRIFIIGISHPGTSSFIWTGAQRVALNLPFDFRFRDEAELTSILVHDRVGEDDFIVYIHVSFCIIHH